MWRVTEHILNKEVGTPTLHEESDDAVEALITRVRGHLTNLRQEVAEAEPNLASWDRMDLAEEAALWFSDTTSDLLKRYLDGAEGGGGDMTPVPTSNLHVNIRDWSFTLYLVHTLDEVTVEFAGEGH